MADDRQERCCPSCRMRYKLGVPPLRDFHQITVSANTVSYLTSAAREFDETAQELTPGECFTAVEFVDWIMPFLVSGRAA